VKRACRGFSLLEVLVAFIILAMALGVLMRIFSGGLGNIGMAEHYSQAVAIAEMKLASVGVESPLTEGEITGEEQGYTWRTSVHRFEEEAPVEAAALLLDLYQVEVTVNWDETATKPRSLRFVTLRAAPRP
jgi:general secretion pathway protein I